MASTTDFDSLPEDLQAIIRVACQAANMDMLSEYNARNASALAQIAADDTIELRRFPDEVLARLKALTYEVMDDLAARDPLSARIWESYRSFMQQSREWQRIGEQAFLATTDL